MFAIGSLAINETLTLERIKLNLFLWQISVKSKAQEN